MYRYVTFFSIGKGSETLSIDYFADNVGDLVVWESQEAYNSARCTEPDPIDGGEFSYGLATGVARAPSRVVDGRIVSYLAPDPLVDVLRVLNSVVRAMRGCEWPEWPEE